MHEGSSQHRPTSVVYQAFSSKQLLAPTEGHGASAAPPCLKRGSNKGTPAASPALVPSALGAEAVSAVAPCCRRSWSSARLALALWASSCSARGMSDVGPGVCCLAAAMAAMHALLMLRQQQHKNAMHQAQQLCAVRGQGRQQALSDAAALVLERQSMQMRPHDLSSAHPQAADSALQTRNLRLRLAVLLQAQGTRVLPQHKFAGPRMPPRSM